MRPRTTTPEELDEARCLEVAGAPDATLLEAIRLRALAGRRLAEAPPAGTVMHPDADRFGAADGLPEIQRDELDAPTLASGIRRHGALIVRGLLGADEVERLLAREIVPWNDPVAIPGVTPRDGAPVEERRQEDIYSMLPVTPATFTDVVGLYESIGLPETLAAYLGEPPVLAAHRLHLKEGRRAPGLPWHQDGAYFGGAFDSVNLWCPLTPVGEDRPGLEIVPRRFGHLLGVEPAGVAAGPAEAPTGSPGVPLGYSRELPPEVIDDALGTTPGVEPVLAPGDALFFDELTLHRTGTAPWRAQSRRLLISWFFAPTRMPPHFTPLAL